MFIIIQNHSFLFTFNKIYCCSRNSRYYWRLEFFVSDNLNISLNFFHFDANNKRSYCNYCLVDREIKYRENHKPKPHLHYASLPRQTEIHKKRFPTGNNCQTISEKSGESLPFHTTNEKR